MLEGFVLSVVFSAFVSGDTTECGRVYQGRCIDVFRGSCKAGDKQVMSHCGFMQFCCYPDPALASQPTTSTGTDACGTPLVISNTRIMGGTRVTPGTYPWQVSLRENGIHMCGGSLIDKQWIVTAAHCFDEDHQSTGWTVAVGFHDSYTLYRSQIYDVRRIISHPNYDPDLNPNDIALVQLAKPVDVTGKYVRTICLPKTTFDLPEGTKCTVTGWGDNKFDGSNSRYLEKIEVPIVSNADCKRHYGPLSTITNTMFCAAVSGGGKDACQGDSGGPFECRSEGVYVLAGVVSRGYKCGLANYPGIYTKVSSFLSWIRKYV